MLDINKPSISLEPPSIVSSASISSASIVLLHVGVGARNMNENPKPRGFSVFYEEDKDLSFLFPFVQLDYATIEREFNTYEKLKPSGDDTYTNDLRITKNGGASVVVKSVTLQDFIVLDDAGWPLPHIKCVPHDWKAIRASVVTKTSSAGGPSSSAAESGMQRSFFLCMHKCSGSARALIRSMMQRKDVAQHSVSVATAMALTQARAVRALLACGWLNVDIHPGNMLYIVKKSPDEKTVQYFWFCIDFEILAANECLYPENSALLQLLSSGDVGPSQGRPPFPVASISSAAPEVLERQHLLRELARREEAGAEFQFRPWNTKENDVGPAGLRVVWSSGR